jgi:hypothetical protein
MTTVEIDIPDKQAAALTAKAAEQGLTLESWFQKVAEEETAGAGVQAQPKHASVVEEMRKLRASLESDPEGWTTRDYVNYGRR